jgi:hypothetical protein
MDKVTEKKEQHAELYKLLATEGYDVVLFPVVLGSSGKLFKCLERAIKDIPKARKKKLCSKLHLHSIHSLQNLRSQRPYLERQKANIIIKGKDKRLIASFPTPTSP